MNDRPKQFVCATTVFVVVAMGLLLAGGASAQTPPLAASVAQQSTEPAVPDGRPTTDQQGATAIAYEPFHARKRYEPFH